MRRPDVEALRAQVAARREQVAARREQVAARRAQVAARRAQRRRGPTAPERRRRRWGWLVLALLLAALLARCRCAPPPPEPPAPGLGAEVVVEPSPAPAPGIPLPRTPPIPRPAFEVPPPRPVPWVEALRLQVAARSPRLARCFEGASGPVTLRWTATVEPRSGQVSASAVEPVLGLGGLGAGERDCVLGVLAEPPFRLDPPADAEPARIGLVLEF